MYRKNSAGWDKHLDFIVLDLIALQIAYILAYVIRHGLRLPYFVDGYQELGLAMTLIDLVVSIVGSSFSGVLKRGKYREFIATLRHVILVLAISVLFTFSMHTAGGFSRITVYLTGVFHFLLGYLGRLGYKVIRRQLFHRIRNVLIVTTADRAADAVDSLNSDISNTIMVAGLAIIDQDLVGQRIDRVKVVANADTVLEYICREWIDEVFLRIPRESDQAEKYYSGIMQMGVTVHLDVGNLSSFEGQKQQFEKLGRDLVVTTSINYSTPVESFLKRLLDIIGGLVGSVLALIVMAVLFIPIKRQSPGPLLYTAERIGRGGKRFKMPKIRSMYMDADARKQELMTQNRVADGMMFKLDWDPRIIGNETLPDGTHKTGIGEFIRKTSLDEFPQFFSVLKGDMSLVGTRPPTPDEWEKYDLHHRARLAIKPGITGMWQVSGRSEITDFEEVVKLDTEYITNWSLGLDIKILLQTVVAVFRHRGAM